MTAAQPEPKSVGVLMIDFCPVIREGLQAILTKDPTIEVIGDAPDEHEAILHIKRAHARGRTVHVVLTETRSGKVDGVQATKLIKQEFPEIGVLVLSENVNDSNVIEAIQSGAAGYLFIKDMSPETLLQSIHRVVEGGTQMSASVLRTAVENLIQNGQKTLAERTTESANLTAREVDVLRLLGNGDSNKLIGATLGITLDTTKKHVRNVIDKLQARNRTHAAIIAAQSGIVGKAVTPVIEGQSDLEPGAWGRAGDSTLS